MEFWDSVLQYLKLVTVMDVVDILLVAFLLYHLLRIVRGTSVQHVLQGILILFGAMILSDVLKLNIINYLLSSVFQIGIIALIILFQPELRKMLQKFGSTHRFSIFKEENESAEQLVKVTINNIAEAAVQMSKDCVGALIVFERTDNLKSVADTGTRINADISVELLKNIFYPKSPLHDGAVIITDFRVTSAGCILPLTAKSNLSKDLGTRHRAALGMSESFDSISLVVSEETGAISIAIGGMLKRHLSKEMVIQMLEKELLPEQNAEDKTTVREWLKGWLKNEKK